MCCATVKLSSHICLRLNLQISQRNAAATSDALVSKETALRGLATNSVCAEEEAMTTKIKELISAINTNRRCDTQDF